MERNIKITLEKAKEWYNSNNESLKDIALQAFSEKELTGKYFGMTITEAKYGDLQDFQIISRYRE